MSSTSPEVTIYTDGACIGNPGPGGYGVVLMYGDQEKELSGGRRLTTNNRMEMLAAIEGLEALKRPCSVTLYSDSQLLVDGVEKGWAARWRKNDWMRNKKEPAINPDLWGRLLDICEKHDVTFRWVRGHAGDPMNERCDLLANREARKPAQPIDEIYESSTRRIV